MNNFRLIYFFQLKNTIINIYFNKFINKKHFNQCERSMQLFKIQIKKKSWEKRLEKHKTIEVINVHVATSLTCYYVYASCYPPPNQTKPT
jgi:hypothetical protein